MESMISDWKESKRYVIDSESVVISTDRVRCGIRELASPRRAPVLSVSRFRDSWFVVREGVGLRADEFLVFMGGFAQAGMMPVIADDVLPASGELPKGEGAYDGKHDK